MIEIRPGVINRALWFPERSDRKAWERIRLAVLKRDDFTCCGCEHQAQKFMTVHHVKSSADDSLENLVTLCPACHAVLHIGLNLLRGTIQIWESDLSQVEVIQRTRAGVASGMTLDAINRTFSLRPGPLPPDSRDYANRLVRSMGSAPRASLPLPLCAVFVKFNRWQVNVASAPDSAAARGGT